MISSLRITEHTSFDELRPWKNRWDEFARGIPFLQWAWMENWWRCYGHNPSSRSRANENSLRPRTNHRLLLLAIWDQEELVGVVPWYLTSSIAEGRVIRFLGSNEVCGDYLTLLCKHTDTRSVVEELTRWLISTSSHQSREAPLWDLVDLQGIFANDFAMHALMMNVYDAGLWVDTTHAMCGWRIELPNDWDNYLARLSKSHRKQIRRIERTLSNDSQFTLHRASNPIELDQAWRVLVDLHTRRWSTVGRYGCFSSPRFCDFHQTMTKHWLSTGQLELLWLEKQGTPIAAEYQIRGPKSLFAYQSGVNPEHLDLEPGRMITTCAIQQSITRGDQIYDLLRGDEPYKAHWRAEPHAMVNMRIIPNRSLAKWRYRLQSTGQSMKRWLGQGWRELVNATSGTTVNHT